MWGDVGVCAGREGGGGWGERADDDKPRARFPSLNSPPLPQLIRWAAGGSVDAVPDFLRECLAVDALPEEALSLLDDPDGGMVPGPDTLLVDPRDYSGHWS